jgi:hypothetical protein
LANESERSRDSRSRKPLSENDFGSSLFVCDHCDYSGTFAEMGTHERAEHGGQT